MEEQDQQGLTDSERKLLRLIAEGMQKKNSWGQLARDWLPAFLIFISVITFYVRANDTMVRLVKISDYLTVFAENSDNYHSSVSGIQFKQGQPTPINNAGFRGAAINPKARFSAEIDGSHD